MRAVTLTLVLGAVLLAAVPAAWAGVTVSNDRTAIATKLGHKFVFHSTIRNDGVTAASDLIAHLNVVDLSGHTYVDPAGLVVSALQVWLGDWVDSGRDRQPDVLVADLVAHLRVILTTLPR